VILHVARSVVSRWCQSASGRPLITSWRQLGSDLGNEELVRRLEPVYTQVQKKLSQAGASSRRLPEPKMDKVSGEPFQVLRRGRYCRGDALVCL
jgi:hypothetical protein